MAKDDPFHPSTPVPTTRVGPNVLRPSGPWTPTSHALLRYLRAVGFTACPEVGGSGFDEQGREILTWVEGEPDGYELPRADRVGLITRMNEFAVRDTAGFARDREITPEFTDPGPLWLLSWNIRAADWMLDHRELLQKAIGAGL